MATAQMEVVGSIPISFTNRTLHHCNEIDECSSVDEATRGYCWYLPVAGGKLNLARLKRG